MLREAFLGESRCEEGFSLEEKSHELIKIKKEEAMNHGY